MSHSAPHQPRLARQSEMATMMSQGALPGSGGKPSRPQETPVGDRSLSVACSTPPGAPRFRSRVENGFASALPPLGEAYAELHPDPCWAFSILGCPCRWWSEPCS